MRLQVRSRSNEVPLRRLTNAYSQRPEVSPAHPPVSTIPAKRSDLPYNQRRTVGDT
jgi:hypothetical protein